MLSFKNGVRLAEIEYTNKKKKSKEIDLDGRC